MRREALLGEVLDALDPRVGARAAFAAARQRDDLWPAADRNVVLVGHRASGKSRLLPLMTAWFGRPGVDLDEEIARRSGRALREWVAADEPGFRRAERATFATLPPGRVVATGGGFLSSHGDLLAGHLAVLVPVTFETYRERLVADRARPRLRPELSLEEEIARVFEEREKLHARVATVPLVEVLASTLDERGGR